MLISGKDTLNTVSNNSGKFSFSLPQAFEVTILAQYQGFDDFCETFQLGGNHLAVVIKMNQSKQLLEAAMIKSEIPFVRAEADTIIYNMAALEKMEGDKALDLFLQIPGFGINKGKITMWGENVDKTYVNGKLIYGDDPISALNLLKAEEVKNVRIYDTQYMADKHRGVKNSKKRRVIDVQTFKQFLSAVDLQAQTRVGSIYKKEDVGSVNPLRFSLGFDFDSNREMQQIGAYSNGNNINDSKNGSDIVKSSPPTLYSDKKNVDVLVNNHVLSESELHSRYEIYLEKYYKTINIEALTMLDMLKKDILPSVSEFEGKLLDLIRLSKELDVYKKEDYEAVTLNKIREHKSKIMKGIEQIESLLSESDMNSSLDKAFYYREKVLPLMDEIREDTDALERICDRECWPMPTYFQLLFGEE